MTDKVGPFRTETEAQRGARGDRPHRTRDRARSDVVGRTVRCHAGRLARPAQHDAGGGERLPRRARAARKPRRASARGVSPAWMRASSLIRSSNCATASSRCRRTAAPAPKLAALRREADMSATMNTTLLVQRGAPGEPHETERFDKPFAAGQPCSMGCAISAATRSDARLSLLLHQCQCLQGMHDADRRRSGLCLHHAAARGRNDALPLPKKKLISASSPKSRRRTSGSNRRRSDGLVNIVIASEAKQSRSAEAPFWIASSLRSSQRRRSHAFHSGLNCVATTSS